MPAPRPRSVIVVITLLHCRYRVFIWKLYRFEIYAVLNRPARVHRVCSIWPTLPACCLQLGLLTGPWAVFFLPFSNLSKKIRSNVVQLFYDPPLTLLSWNSQPITSPTYSWSKQWQVWPSSNRNVCACAGEHLLPGGREVRTRSRTWRWWTSEWSRCALTETVSCIFLLVWASDAFCCTHA
jgi:hypothetical protein